MFAFLLLFKQLVFFLIFILFSPIIIILFLPLLIWRLFVKTLAKIFKRKQFGEIFSATDAYFLVCNQNFYINPSCIVTGLLTLQGSFITETVKSSLDKTLSERRRDGSFIFARFRQHPIRWLGFQFFEWDKNFKIDDHITFVQDKGQGYTREDLAGRNKINELLNKYSGNPFKKNCSLWHLTAIQNFGGNKDQTVLIFRFHHVLADGFSMLQFFGQTMGVKIDQLQLPVQQKSKLSRGEKFLEIYRATIGLPYDIFRFITRKAIKGAKPPIQCRMSGSTLGSPFFSMTSKIPIGPLKMARQSFGIPLVGILAIALNNAMNKFFAKQMAQGIISMDEIPTALQLLLPFPKTSRISDDQISNSFKFGRLVISLDSTSLPEKLQLWKSGLNKALTENFKYPQQFLLNFFGILPVPIFVSALKFTSRSEMTICITNMPGPNYPCSLLNNQVTDIMFFSHPDLTVSVIAAVLSYNGYIRIGLSAIPALINNQNSIDELSKDIEVELDMLTVYANECSLKS